MKESVKKIVKASIWIAIVIGFYILFIMTMDKNKIVIDLNKRKLPLFIFFITSLLMFILSIIINRKIKTKEIRKETNGLVSPILAEAVVDGKIALKEMLMTTIIELNIKGNIKIINNNTLELVSRDNLEKYEQSIVDLIFKKNIINFSDINNIFIKSNQGTIEFSKKINECKAGIIEKIRGLNIFSKKLAILNMVITVISIFICINLTQLFMKTSSTYRQLFFWMSVLIIMYYVKKCINKSSIKNEILKERKRSSLVLPIIIMIIILIFSIIYVSKSNIMFLIFAICTVILNIYTIYKSQANVLTKEGKNEQIELLKLKNYINKYSLIKNRDLESVIVWDEYLAYATAFGIPNKVTNTVYESWYNLNMNLQLIEKIL